MNNEYRSYRPEEMDLILVKTTDQGPFVEDLFYLLFKEDQFWQIPGSEPEELFTWLSTSDKIDWFQSILASCSVVNATFILWRKEGSPVFSDQKREELRSRFVALIQKHSDLTFDESNERFVELLSRYSESHRGYHTIQHILHCLWELDRSNTAGLNRDELEFAIWYHDAVYEIKSKTNEEQSAELMRLHLQPTRVDLNAVEKLILASKHLSGGAPRSPEIDLFLDIDLSVLGQRELDYRIYRRQVREEYSAIGALRYAVGRKKVLRHFQKMQIYRTASFQDRYEAQAKANIAQELKAYWWIP